MQGKPGSDLHIPQEIRQANGLCVVAVGDSTRILEIMGSVKGAEVFKNKLRQVLPSDS